jgi:DNA-binding MarR family transcriptional regulator
MTDPSVGYLLNRAARLLRKLADRRLAPLGLSSGHLPVLTALMGGEPLSQKSLIEMAGIEQPTMAATLGRMERDGIIARKPDPQDRRSFLYALTPAARRKVPHIRAAIEGMNLTALGGLADDDRARMRALLAVSIASLERALDRD